MFLFWHINPSTIEPRLMPTKAWIKTNARNDNNTNPRLEVKVSFNFANTMELVTRLFRANKLEIPHCVWRSPNVSFVAENTKFVIKHFTSRPTNRTMDEMYGNCATSFGYILLLLTIKLLSCQIEWIIKSPSWFAYTLAMQTG